MTALLTEGLTDAYRNLSSALRLFWPVLATFLVLYAIAFAIGYSLSQAEATPIDNPALVFPIIAIALVGIVYVFFMLCQGAVGWHRRILLNERPGWVSLLPRRRAFQYALAVFLLSLVIMIAQIPLAYFLLPWMQSTFAPITWDANAGTPTPEQLQAIQNALWKVQIVAFVAGMALMSVVLLLMKSWLLVFPHISIRTAGPVLGGTALTPPAGFVGALLIVYFLPSLISLLYGFLVPLTIQMIPWLSVPAFILQVGISAFCFLWGLSLLSMAYALAAANRGAS